MEINSSRKAYEILRKLSDIDVEEFWILALNRQLQLITKQMLFRGTVDSCLIHPRDMIRFVCGQNSSSFIIAHNHPSGNPRPSREDRMVTRRFFAISQLIEIPLQDHVIIGKESYFSFADSGFFKKQKRARLSEPLHLKS